MSHIISKILLNRSYGTKRSEVSRLLVYMFTFIIFCSCDMFSFQSEIDLSDQTTPPKLVLNAIIFADREENALEYSRSYSIFDPEYGRNTISYTSGWDGKTYHQPDNKVYHLSDVETAFYVNDVIQNTKVNPEDSITYIKANIKTNDRLKIESKWNGKTINSYTEIPEKPQLEIISHENGQLHLRLKDQANTEKYYRLQIISETEAHLKPEFAEKHGIPHILYKSSSGYETNDPLITWGNPKNDDSDFDVTNFEQNYLQIFTNSLFKGKEYELKLWNLPYVWRIDYYYLNPNDWNSRIQINEEDILRNIDRTYISFQGLSKELYTYYSSISAYTQLNDEAVEPIRVYSNIEGGLGIFGAINENRILVKEEITE